MQIDICPECEQYVIAGDGVTRHAEEVIIFRSPTDPHMKPLDLGEFHGRRFVVTGVSSGPRARSRDPMQGRWQVRGVYLDPVMRLRDVPPRPRDLRVARSARPSVAVRAFRSWSSHRRELASVASRRRGPG